MPRSDWRDGFPLKGEPANGHPSVPENQIVKKGGLEIRCTVGYWGLMTLRDTMVKKAKDLSSLRWEISKLTAKADALREELLEFGDFEDPTHGIAVTIRRTKVRRLAPLAKVLKVYSELQLRHDGLLSDAWIDRVDVKTI